MKTRALVVVALFSLAAGLDAQGGVRRPGRVGTGTLGGSGLPIPSHPAPEMPVAARAMAQMRSRWSSEAYTMVSSLEVPTVAGVLQRYTTFGTGTRANYRFNNHMSANIDMTRTLLGDPSTTETVEVGTIYRPITEYKRFQPFVGMRGAYMHLYNSFIPATEAVNTPGSADFNSYYESRLSHGIGGAAAGGVDFSLTRNFLLTTELSAMRSRLRVYETTDATGLPVGAPFSTTSYRLMIGLKYNPMRTQHLRQDPTR